MKDIEKLKETVKQILKDSGIKMQIGGCGCCGSPWVKFEKDGNLIVDGEDDFSIDMFEKNESTNPAAADKTREGE